MAEQNYFTCTLEHAEKRRRQNLGDPSFETILQMVEEQAENIPNLEAIGYSGSDFDDDSCEVLTYRELKNLSVSAAQLLYRQVGVPSKPLSSTVGLLCQSSIEFVLTWLGLLRLGWSTLFISPSLGAREILHLCRELSIGLIISDESGRERVLASVTNVKKLAVPSYQDYYQEPPPSPMYHFGPLSEFAYIFHSSGTSSGLPKPILHPQRGAVKTLPRFDDKVQPATFTATPLYHGGLPDCLRAWTSGAMIWNFPEGHIPITKGNIIKTVEAARKRGNAPVKYFSSVPYVLQLLAEQDDGINLLKSMDLVGVGGASLPHVVGDTLVNKGVNLLSRYGTAECGFLMSSHRDYANDKEWLSLRTEGESGLLDFEPRENGCFELVLTPEWPFLAKSNRQGGSYATSDLFSPHPEVPNRWHYEGRADSQITLLNGKKFDPAALEESILESVSSLQDVLVVGDNCDSAGALLFPKSLDASPEDLLDQCWPDIEQLNAKFPSHARISRQMCAVVDTHNGTTTLPKSSKGTTQRRQAHQQYEEQINSLYKPNSGSSNRPKVEDCELPDAVMACFRNVLGHSIMPDKDIFRQGVDSIASSQIRKQIMSTCLADTDQSLPMNILFEMSTVDNLVQHLRRSRGEIKGPESDVQSKELETMQKLVSDIGDFSALRVGNRDEERRESTVVLSGATGFLGSFLLGMLRQDSSVKRVYCLVRADTFPEAHERVSQALSRRGIPGPESFAASSHGDGKVICVPCTLSEQSLGLSEEMQQRIIKDATLFIHSAWAVSFNLGVSSFQDHLAGTRNFINLAMKASAHFVLVSSTAAVMETQSGEIREQLSTEAEDASKLGYARSKWVAEQICGKARAELFEKSRTSVSAITGEPISIVRVGQLCGVSNGVWNSSEAYPVMLSSASRTGCLPDLPGVHLDWIPVDSAASAVLEIAVAGENQTQYSDKPQAMDDVASTPVYHVLNSLKNPSWSDMLGYILTKYETPPFKIVSNAEWLDKLNERVEQGQATNAEEQLIGFWQETLQGSKPDDGGRSQARSVPGFATDKTRMVSPTMNDLTPLDLEMAMRYWEWVQNIGG